MIVATAYFPQGEDQRAADVLKDEGYKMAGNAPIYAILREARDRAQAAGANERRGEGGRRRAGGRSGRPRRRKSRRTCSWSATSGLSTIAGRLLGVGAGQRRAAVQDRRADRSHHAVDLG